MAQKSKVNHTTQVSGICHEVTPLKFNLSISSYIIIIMYTPTIYLDLKLFCTSINVR